MSAKTFSEQEQRDYYRAWESSGMQKSTFCSEHGLSVGQFYYWHKRFRKNPLPDEPKEFSPLSIKVPTHQLPQNMTQLELQLPNQAKLLLRLRENQLVSFIQELCHAVTVIR